MDVRNETRKDVLLEVLEEPITTIDALVECCHRALSAEIGTTCHWSENGSGWKVGDYNDLVVTTDPDPDSGLYVQFWSEPQEPVVIEVCSGEWSPGAIRYIGPGERRTLEERGYEIAGRARRERAGSCIRPSFRLANASPDDARRGFRAICALVWSCRGGQDPYAPPAGRRSEPDHAGAEERDRRSRPQSCHSRLTAGARARAC